MHDLVRLLGCRPGLNGFDVAVFVDRDVRKEVAKDIGAGRRHLVGRELDDDVGLADLPFAALGKGARRGHGSGVALWGSGVDPAGNQLDLGIAQGGIVFERLDADGPIDVERRHVARHDAALDRSGPGPDFLVGRQGHGRDLALPMAGLARPLEDRRDVLGEGRCREGRPALRVGCRGRGQNHCHHRAASEPRESTRHVGPLGERPTGIGEKVNTPAGRWGIHPPDQKRNCPARRSVRGLRISSGCPSDEPNVMFWFFTYDEFTTLNTSACADSW